jgi:hypothetical protein
MTAITASMITTNPADVNQSRDLEREKRSETEIPDRIARTRALAAIGILGERKAHTVESTQVRS